MCPQSEGRVRLSENSDWWSGLQSIDSDESIKTQEREVAHTNFKVLGVKLNDKILENATAKFGKGTFVERGDAALGREQLCFVSAKGTRKTYLIFERGEVHFSFYLFTGGKKWTGEEYCAKSDAISELVTTGSGLRLGIGPQEVMRILGRPSLHTKNQLLYSLHVQKKNDKSELAEVGKYHPELSAEDLRRDYEFYDWSAGIDCKFENSKLTFLAVSMSGTY